MPFDPPRHKRGDPVRASDRNAQNHELGRLRNIRGGPGVFVRQGAGGFQIAVDEPEEIYIKLTGTANGDGGYPWKQVYHVADGTWTDSTRTGSTAIDPAYDRFGNTSLSAGDTVYRARRAPTSGAWIFRNRIPPVPAVAGCFVAFYLSDYCTSATLASGTVTLNSGGTPIGTASVTVGTLLTITLGAGGSGYAPGWHYLAFSGGGGSGAAGEFHVSATGHVDQVALTSGGSGYTSAPTVSFPGAGGSGATATVTAGDAATFAGVATGSYTLDATSTGYNSITGTPETIASCPTAPIQIQLVPATTSVTVDVASPCSLNPLSGATATLSGTGYSGSGTTTASGYTFTGVPTQVLMTAGASYPPRFTSATGSAVSYTCGGTPSVTLGVASGYVCSGPPGAGTACDYPLKTSLLLNDPFFGITSLSFTYASGVWTGSTTTTFPGCAPFFSCQGFSCTVTYTWDPLSIGGLKVDVSFPAPNATCSFTLTPGSGTGLSSYTCPPSLTIACSVTYPGCGSATNVTITE